MPISEMADKFPEAFAQFEGVCKTLEYHYRDMQDMEFTVEAGKLYMLQTRNGKRTAAAALKIACDLVDEGMITEREAVAMIDPKSLDALLHPTFPKEELERVKPIGQGLAASPGAAAGQIVFTADDVVEWVDKGHKVILLRLRLRRHRHQRGSQAVHPGRAHLQGGRLDQPGRLHRQHLRRAPAHRRGQDLRRV